MTLSGTCMFTFQPVEEKSTANWFSFLVVQTTGTGQKVLHRDDSGLPSSPSPAWQQGFLNLIVCGSKVSPLKDSEYTWMKKNLNLVSGSFCSFNHAGVCLLLWGYSMCVKWGRHYETEIFSSLYPQWEGGRSWHILALLLLQLQEKINGKNSKILMGFISSSGWSTLVSYFLKSTNLETCRKAEGGAWKVIT